MTLNDIWTIFTKIIDILIVWIAFYYILKNVKNNIKMVLIVKGVVLVLLVKFLSNIMDLYTVGLLIEYILQWGPLAIIVIFQPEIRSVLESIGRTQLLGRHKVLTVDEREKIVFEIMRAIEYLKRNKIGALIVIERELSLQQYIEPATKVYADLSYDLLETIFFPNSPMHDGGVIIQGDRITCAGAVFPTSNSQKINRRLGTRHRAALGLAEETDAICIVVSEETGRISVALKGELLYNLTTDDTRMLLIDELRPKQDINFDEEEIDILCSSDKRINVASDSILGKVFGYFFEN